MSSKYKPGDKVWVKAVVVPSRGVGDEEVVVRIRTSFGEYAIAVTPNEDVVCDTSPWQPIESAPKDGTWILVTNPTWICDKDPRQFVAETARWITGKQLGGGCEAYAGWAPSNTDENTYEPTLLEPTHWMLIPKLEVE